MVVVVIVMVIGCVLVFRESQMLQKHCEITKKIGSVIEIESDARLKPSHVKVMQEPIPHMALRTYPVSGLSSRQGSRELYVSRLVLRRGQRVLVVVR